MRGSVIACAAAIGVLGLAGGSIALGASPDSEAPRTAPAHWLAPEAWIYNHWLPYDEGRLYRLLRIDRGRLWRQLRDDRHTVAELAARRGWRDPKRLAAALVAPLARDVSRRRLATLRSRALRTLTQGHLAQHVFFHSLHQFAIPSEAPSIFGMTDIEFRALRREELSPLQIGRLHGRSPARVHLMCADVLRERVRAGVRGHSMTARQGRILLRRQLSQLPRWLAQARYNGPPLTHHGRLVTPPSDYASNPAISLDGAVVAYEAYQQKLPLALRDGEISVRLRALDGSGAAVRISGPPQVRDPHSAYNPTVSGDGRLVAYESSPGNSNFAKRYGQIDVLLHDRAAAAASEVHHGRQQDERVSRSAYNPVLAAGGRVLVFQAVRPSGRAGIYVRDLATGATRLVSAAARTADVYEPSISADGARVAFVAVDRRGRSRVLVHDVTDATTATVPTRSWAASPSLSADGRLLALVTAGDGRGAPAKVVLRDLASGATIPVSRAGDGAAIEPSVSADGRHVAFTAFRGGRTRVLVRDTVAGTTELVSRAAEAADAAASDPSISGDGMRVAFASTATNLSPRHQGGSRAIYVRDRRTGTTTFVAAGP